MKSKDGAYVSRKYSFPVYRIHSGLASLSRSSTIIAVRPQASQDQEMVKHWPKRAASWASWPLASSKAALKSLLTLASS